MNKNETKNLQVDLTRLTEACERNADDMIMSEYGYSCSEYGCCEEGICRCSTIDSVEFDVSLCNIEQILGDALTGEPDKLARFLFLRLFKAFFDKADVEDLLDVKIEDGYYGEEIRSITLNPKSYDWTTFLSEVDSFNSMSNTEKMEYLLRKEYGFLIKEVKSVTEWEMVNVSLNEIHPDKTVLKKAAAEHYVTDRYFGDFGGLYVQPKIPKNFAMATVYPISTGGYRVMDGYHRFAAISKILKKKPETKVCVLRPKNDVVPSVMVTKKTRKKPRK